jgi:hypothetical protein
MGWNRTPQQLAAALANYLMNGEAAIIETLHRVGQEAVNWARQNGSFDDQTGNLRNSIGYSIYKDGQLLDFILDDGGHPEAYSKTVMSQTVWERDVPEKGYSLIVFAGMEYGIFVEARGKIVLSGSLKGSETGRILEEALKKVRG